MIRNAIIVVLTLTAVCVTIIAGMSYAGHLRTPLWQVGNWRLCLYARDTIARGCVGFQRGFAELMNRKSHRRTG